MKQQFLNFFLFVTFLVPLTSASRSCNQTCGGRKLPFPFGFSSGCGIQLNCSSDATILAADFIVQSITADTILINIPATCGRPMASLRRLFTRNYAPTSHNAILLQNCSAEGRACFIPTTMLQTHFELQDCNAKKDSISCYSEPNNRASFIDYQNLIKSGCRWFFSAISMESLLNSSSVSLDIQIVRMGWWLQGECRCSENAICIRVPPPVEGNSPGYRCRCSEGFAGDGFADGLGCRKESSGCNPSVYLSDECGGTTRVAVLVGGILAGASSIISIGLIFCCIRRISNLRSITRKSHGLCKTRGINIRIYPYKEMEKATNSFSEKRRLGNGAYGTVYSGKLNGGEWVAVKRIKHRDDSDSNEQVINEIKLLSSVSHPNLVRLLGCSIENKKRILVYELMPNGTLSQHLQREKGTVLPWPVRLAIAAETAHAISYLHNAMDPPIYHRDIKSSNILLDYNYKSKVADFGLSRLGMMETSHVSTAPQGTPGYLDPQYHQHFHLSDKSDVYSFGVVLFEIITGMRVVDFSRPRDEVNLANLAIDRIGRGCLDEIIDPFLVPNLDVWMRSSVHKVGELAFRCLAFHRDMRPTMNEVATELERIKLSKWTNSLPEMSMEETGVTSRSDSTSNLNENPLNCVIKKEGFDSKSLFDCTNSSDVSTEFSPDSVQDSWRSD